MAGLADGFAQGFGMMDSTLRANREEELRAKLAERDNARYADTLARQDRQDKVSDSRFTTTSGLQQAQLDATIDNNNATHLINKQQANTGAAGQKANERIGLANVRVAKQNANTQEANQQSLEESRVATEKHQESQDKSNESRDKAAIKASDLVAKKTEAEIKHDAIVQKANEAQQRLFTYGQDENGSPKVPDNPNDFSPWADDVLTGFGVDIRAVNGDVGEYHGYNKTLQSVFENHDNKEITEAKNPKEINAFNKLFKSQIDTGVGDPYIDKDGKDDGSVITGKRVVNMLSVPVDKSAEFPEGRAHTFGVIVTWKDKDGASHTSDTPEPMTAYRSMNTDRKVDPVRLFSDETLFHMVNVNRAIIDEVSNNPVIKEQLRLAKERNSPTDKESRTIPYTGEEGERQSAVRMKDGSYKDVRHLLQPDKQVTPIPTQKALDYLAEHPETKDQFKAIFKYSPD